MLKTTLLLQSISCCACAIAIIAQFFKLIKCEKRIDSLEERTNCSCQACERK